MRLGTSWFRSCLLLLAAAGFPFWASAQETPGDGCDPIQVPLTVGFLYGGPPTDNGWYTQHDLARLSLERTRFGANIRTVARQADQHDERASLNVIEHLIENLDARLIFSTSSPFQSAVMQAAERHPCVYFEQTGAGPVAPNVARYTARWYEGRYLAGRIAALMPDVHKAGYIASVRLPQVYRGINAFTLGARSIDPDFEVSVRWLDTFSAPARERKAAHDFLDEGAHILLQHTNSTAPMEVAEERGVWAFGQGRDWQEVGPRSQLTAIVNDWAPYYSERTEAVLDGTWEAGLRWDGFTPRQGVRFSCECRCGPRAATAGMSPGMVAMAPYAHMPDWILSVVEQTEIQLTTGELSVFSVAPDAPPIVDVEGNVKVAPGEALEGQGLRGMRWLVQGVDELPL